MCSVALPQVVELDSDRRADDRKSETREESFGLIFLLFLLSSIKNTTV